MPPEGGTTHSGATETLMIRLSPTLDVIFVPPSLLSTSARSLTQHHR
jgi:hypothetical protein